MEDPRSVDVISSPSSFSDELGLPRPGPPPLPRRPLTPRRRPLPQRPRQPRRPLTCSRLNRRSRAPRVCFRVAGAAAARPALRAKATEAKGRSGFPAASPSLRPWRRSRRPEESLWPSEPVQFLPQGLVRKGEGGVGAEGRGCLDQNDSKCKSLIGKMGGR